MRIQSDNISFKGYDARPLKGFLMSGNYGNLAEELQTIEKNMDLMFLFFKNPSSRVDFSLPFNYYICMSNFRRYYRDNYPVFITIVTYNRCPLLLDNIQFVRTAFKSIKYPFSILAGIVLEDHIHIIIAPPKAEDIPKIIASFKANFSKNLPVNTEQTVEQLARREKGIWQRKYYDHIIRNENDLNRHLDYIHYNSMKHHNIAPKDWQYSSFIKFVKRGYYDINWCNYDDKNNIIDLDLE